MWGHLTVLFDICAAFALGHSAIFKIDMGQLGASKGQGQLPCPSGSARDYFAA